MEKRLPVAFSTLSRPLDVGYALRICISTWGASYPKKTIVIIRVFELSTFCSRKLKKPVSRLAFLLIGSGNWIRTNDLQVMSLTS